MSIYVIVALLRRQAAGQSFTPTSPVIDCATGFRCSETVSSSTPMFCSTLTLVKGQSGAIAYIAASVKCVHIPKSLPRSG